MKIIKLIYCFLFVFIFFIGITFPFWTDFITKNNNTDVPINIGEWDITPTPAESLTNFAFRVLNSSALLSAINRPAVDGRNSIYILGREDDGDLRMPEGPFKYLDVFIWRRSTKDGGRIAIAQKIGDFDEQQVFSSWDNLRLATLNPNIKITLVARYEGETETLVSRYENGVIYTTTHAPVTHIIEGVERKFLAYHNNAIKEPGVDSNWQTDWFEISDTWLPQVYPAGSFVEHDSRHYRSKIYTTASQTPPDPAAWEEILRYDPSQDITTWINDGRAYPIESIVRYSDKYYYSNIDSNTHTPGENEYWIEFLPYDKRDTVKTWSEDLQMDLGDFIRVKAENPNDPDIYYLKIDGGTSSEKPSQSWGWTIVKDYYDVVGVARWNPSILYGNGYVGLIVEYQNQLFEKQASWSPMGETPLENGNAWVRIYTWSDTQKPLTFQRTTNPIGSVLDAGEFYVGTINQTGTWTTIDNTDRYQRIEPWDENTTYHGLNLNSWNNVSDIYYAYTTENGEKVFWRGRQNASANTNEFPTNDSNFWERIVFENTFDTIATKTQNDWLIWDLNEGMDKKIIPSLADTNWTLRQNNTTSSEYVYTVKDGFYLLWKNIAPDQNATLEPGETINGVAHFELVPFKTGKQYVYQENNVGYLSFWYSQNESNTAPVSANGQSSNWILLNEGELAFLDDCNYVYVLNSDNSISYFKTTTDIRNNAWEKVENAWIASPDSEMINYWDNETVYQQGDIVVFGTSMLDTYRYFRFVSSEYSLESVGHIPYHDGKLSIYWEPINPFLEELLMAKNG